MGDARHNHDETIATLAAAAAGTYVTSDFDNPHGDAITAAVDITAVTGSLTVTIQGKDPASGKYYTILASAALAAVATTVLRVFPGAAVTANVSANDVLPKTWRVQYVVATGPVTATIGGSIRAAGSVA